MQKFYCPKCPINRELVFSKKKGKFICPFCGFVDRRAGSSCIDPKMERRGKLSPADIVWERNHLR
jgi:ribosomal protein S27E